MTETSQQPLPQTVSTVKAQKSENADFFKFMIKLGLFVLILRSLIFAPFNIPSESMLSRLMIGDYLIVAKWPYGYSKYSLPFSVPLIPGRILAKEPKRGPWLWPSRTSYRAENQLRRGSNPASLPAA